MRKLFWILLNVVTFGIPALIVSFAAKRRVKAENRRAVSGYVKETLDVLMNAEPPRPRPIVTQRKPRTAPKPAGTRTKMTFVMVRYHGRRVAAKFVGWLGRGNRLEAVLPDGKILRPRRRNVRMFSSYGNVSA